MRPRESPPGADRRESPDVTKVLRKIQEELEDLREGASLARVEGEI